MAPPRESYQPPVASLNGIFAWGHRVWTDPVHADRISITEIAARGRAYFDLVRQLPEVGSFDRPWGIEVWRPGRLGGLVRNFRGT